MTIFEADISMVVAETGESPKNICNILGELFMKIHAERQRLANETANLVRIFQIEDLVLSLLPPEKDLTKEGETKNE